MKAWLGLEEKEQSYMDLGGSQDAENPLTAAANSVARTFALQNSLMG